MDRFWKIASAIVALLIVLLVGSATAMFYGINPSVKIQIATLTPRPTSNPSITVTPNPHITSPRISPTPATQIEGTIVSVSAQPATYNNAAVIIRQTTNTQIPLYITSQTIVTDLQGSIVNKTQLIQGMKILAKGTPVEGGIEVSKIQIVSK